VSDSVLWHLSDVIQSLHLQTNRTNVSLFTRFFLMYLINKDETEHTGQVRHVTMLTAHHINNEVCFKHIGYACVFDRNHMCGRCTKRDAGISSLLETASENNMKTSLHKCNSVLYLVFKLTKLLSCYVTNHDLCTFILRNNVHAIYG